MNKWLCVAIMVLCLNAVADVCDVPYGDPQVRISAVEY